MPQAGAATTKAADLERRIFEARAILEAQNK